MFNSAFSGSSGPRTILCLGAHCDDIEIGCGGGLLRLLRQQPGCTVHYVVLSAEGEREREARTAAACLLENAALRDVRLQQFRNGYFPWLGDVIKDYFESLKAEVSPDLIFTHWRHDRHQDHRIVSDLTWNTFRNHRIMEYEIPKYDGDIGQPNLFVPLSNEELNAKVRLLMACFPSQRHRPWFTEDTFRALMRLRGMECNAPSGSAEAYHCRKLVF